jgi:hypothetical protein
VPPLELPLVPEMLDGAPDILFSPAAALLLPPLEEPPWSSMDVLLSPQPAARMAELIASSAPNSNRRLQERTELAGGLRKIMQNLFIAPANVAAGQKVWQ